MKNIVVLDAHTLSPLQPGEHSSVHPSWDTLAALGPIQLYPRTSPDQVVERAQNAQILLTNKALVSADHINALPNLEYIGVLATGYNIVDLEAAKARSIPVTNVPGYGTASVAQHVFALMLELAARIGATDSAVKNGDWVRCPDFCFTVSPFYELAGKTIGIVGYGTIGHAVARIAAAFGMKILATARSPKTTDIPVEWVQTDELFSRSDVITLHCPLTDQTRNLINEESLAKMKSTAFLINTGRGPLIDEAALAKALENNVIAGFGADVLSSEPPSRSNPLLTAPNTIITPHIAWASVEARTRLMGIAAKNILDFLTGAPTNVVNGLGSEAEKAPAPPEPPKLTDTHVSNETLASDEIPISDEIPVSDEIPASDETPAFDETSVFEPQLRTEARLAGDSRLGRDVHYSAPFGGPVFIKESVGFGTDTRPEEPRRLGGNKRLVGSTQLGTSFRHEKPGHILPQVSQEAPPAEELTFFEPKLRATARLAGDSRLGGDLRLPAHFGNPVYLGASSRLSNPVPSGEPCRLRGNTRLAGSTRLGGSSRLGAAE